MGLSLWRRAGHLLMAAGALAGLAGASTATAQPLLERQFLTGNWNGIRPALSAHGFEPYLTYTGVMWGNLAGGETTGTQANGYLNFGMDVDFGKLGTWPGLGLHTDFHWWQGQEPTGRLIGGLAAMALSGWEASDAFRVYNIYLRQALGTDDRVVIKLGQIAADTDFMVSRYGGIFLNAAFGDLPSQNLNIDAPVYPLAAAGVFAAARPWSWLTHRVGVYTGDPGDDVAGNHGFDWNLGNNAGYTFFTEIGADLPGCVLPGTYTLGGIYDTGGADQFGTTQRLDRYEVYVMADQALTVDLRGEPGIGVFARLTGTPQESRNVVGIYADAGLVWFGPLDTRPHDVVGAAVSVLRFTDESQQQNHMAGTPVGSGQSVLEVTYQVAIAPWLVVQPNLQFFFNPAFSRRDAQALGGEVVAIF